MSSAASAPQVKIGEHKTKSLLARVDQFNAQMNKSHIFLVPQKVNDRTKTVVSAVSAPFPKKIN